jgi:hypothetical protein
MGGEVTRGFGFRVRGSGFRVPETHTSQPLREWPARPSFRNPEPGTRNPEPGTRNPEPDVYRSATFTGPDFR